MHNYSFCWLEYSLFIEIEIFSKNKKKNLSDFSEDKTNQHVSDFQICFLFLYIFQ